MFATFTRANKPPMCVGVVLRASASLERDTMPVYDVACDTVASTIYVCRHFFSFSRGAVAHKQERQSHDHLLEIIGESIQKHVVKSKGSTTRQRILAANFNHGAII